MGAKQSGGPVQPPEGPIVDVMRAKHGEDSLSKLNIWTEMFGFPKGGSLSKVKIKELRDKLQECEDGMKN